MDSILILKEKNKDLNSYTESGNIGIKKSCIANYEKSKIGVDKLYSSIECASNHLRTNNDLTNQTISFYENHNIYI